MLRTGVILDERYRLDDPIAAGGVGQVWRGTDLVLQRRVALKLLRPEYAKHPETLERFRAEARHAGSLTHPCIAQVYDYGDGGSAQLPFLVMELVDGPSLADVLAVQPVSAAYALEVISKAATGLAAAHRAGLVHRDLKPGNILLGAEGQVKITDFGIAHAAGSSRLTDPGLVMGTTQYLAPERIAGTPATPASDLYSMGIMLHECLTSVPPFEGTPAEVMAAHLYLPLPPPPADTPAEVEELISRLTCKDPSGRLSDAGDLAAIARRLATAVETGRVSPPRQRPAPRISPADGFLAAGSVPAVPGVESLSGPGLPRAAAGSAPSAPAGSAPSAAAGSAPSAAGPGPASGSPSSGFALDTDFPPAGGFLSGAGLRAVGEPGVPGETNAWPQEPGYPPARRGAARLLAGQGAVGRRRKAIASGLVLLAVAGVTGWLLAGGGHRGRDGDHGAQPASLGVVLPSVSGTGSTSPGASATPPVGAQAAEPSGKPSPAKTHASAKARSKPSASPASSARGSTPSASASPSSASTTPPPQSPTPSPSPACILVLCL